MTNAELQSRVKEIIDRTEAAPFLFVGTGMSKRYVQAPSWPDLLKWAASLTEQEYSRYLQEANRKSERSEDYAGPRIGSLIDERFNDIWWEDDKYKEQREGRKETDSIPNSPLKLQIAKKMQEVSSRNFPEYHEEEIEILKNATVDGIITTNYDTILEDRIFSDYTSYTGQDEVIFSERHSVAEIYKIHGSSSDPDSLVLTQEDYNEFQERNAYLAAKLITIFLEHPVIFLGYSINDSNIQDILSEIIQCLDPDRLDTLGDRLIFVEYNRDDEPPSMGSHSKQVAKRDLRLTRVTAHDYTPIFRALSERNRRLNAKLIRQVKEEMYELVQSNDPKEKLHVVGIEDLDDHEEVEIVVGVGVRERLARKGIEEISIDALFHDLVKNENQFEDFADEIVTIRIKNWITTHGGRFVPIYKYLRSGNLLDENHRVLEDEVPPAVLRLAEMDRDRFEYSSIGENTKAQYRDKTVQQVIEEFDDTVIACRYATLVRNPDIDRIQEFLSENINLLTDDRGRQPFRWLACIYDRMKFGPEFNF